MEKNVASGANQQMAQQAVQNIQGFQAMPTAKGYIPDHTVLPVFQRLAEAEAQKNAASQAQQAEAQFFVNIGGEQKGPINLEQLQGLAIVDVINEQTMVWRTGTPEWTDLKTCLANL